MPEIDSILQDILTLKDDDLDPSGIPRKLLYTLHLLDHKQQALGPGGAFNEDIERFLAQEQEKIKKDPTLQGHLFSIKYQSSGEYTSIKLQDIPPVPDELITNEPATILLNKLLNSVSQKHQEYQSIAKKRNFLFKPNKQRLQTVNFLQEKIAVIQSTGGLSDT